MKGRKIITAVRISFLTIALAEILALFISNSPDKNSLWLDLVVTSTSLYLASEVIWRYRHPRLPIPVTTYILLVLFGASDALGSGYGWYDKWTWYDLVIHGLGGAATSMYLYYLFRTASLYRRLQLPNWLYAYLAIASTSILGILFEALEMTIYVITNRTELLNAAIDTVIDLLLNIAGGLGAAAVLMLRERRNLAHASFLQQTTPLNADNNGKQHTHASGDKKRVYES